MGKQEIYNKKITWRSVLLLTLPTILMTLIQASYSMIDGIFISNILGEGALSALTLISPYFNLFIAIGAMFASGGSAVVMKKIGEKNEAEARKDFTSITLTSIAVGGIFTLIFLLFTDNLVNIFSATANVVILCKEYLLAYSFFIIPQILFAVMQVFTIGSGNAKLAMSTSIIGGITNILLDYILIKALDVGMTGAAIASGLGMVVPCVVLFINFTKKQNLLYFIKPDFNKSVLIKTATNGSSEFASNLVSGIVIMLFNARMLAIAGANGVAASTITFYVFGLMSAIYMGYMLGVSPLLSYFYGAKQSEQLKKIRNISVIFISFLAISTTILSITGSKILVSAFTKVGTPAYGLALSGNKLFSIALLFVGFNTFSSMLFTALSNGKISAIIAFSRSFVFLVVTIIILPIIWGINGLWLALPVSEFLAFILSGYLINKYKKVYNY